VTDRSGRGGKPRATVRRAATARAGTTRSSPRLAPRSAHRTREPDAGPRTTLAAYLRESRDIGLSLLLVLPLLLAYEIAMLAAHAPLRNGAEMVVSQLITRLTPETLAVLRRGLLLLLMVVALVLVRAAPPRHVRAHWILGEALLFALLLGPLLGLMVGGLGLSVNATDGTGSLPAWLPFLLSIGAGLWEEIVFRLGLLGGMTWLLVRAFGLDRRAALGCAIVVSSLAFALYHHVGAMGEPLTADRFVFRALAGTILGILFAARGLAVVVYMHVFYDVLCDLRTLHG